MDCNVQEIVLLNHITQMLTNTITPKGAQGETLETVCFFHALENFEIVLPSILLP